MKTQSFLVKALALLISSLLPLTTNAALLTIAQYPLFLSSNTATPNILWSMTTRSPWTGR